MEEIEGVRPDYGEAWGLNGEVHGGDRRCLCGR